MRSNERKRSRKIIKLKKEEKILYEKGIVSICGIDEAGRGPLAGPVVVACSLMPKESMIEGVNDSKKYQKRKEKKYMRKLYKKQLHME